MNDVIVDQVRQVREELINRHRGIDGYFKHYQAQDLAWAKRRKSRSLKQTVRAGRKSTKAT